MTETLSDPTEAPEQHLVAFFDPANRADPYPALRRLREASPFLAMNGNLTVLARHRDVEQALRHPAASADRTRSKILSSQAVESRREVMTFLDPPDHTRLRKLVSKGFTPRMVTALTPQVRAIVNGMIDELAAHGSPADLPSVFAYPIPVKVICELIGVPADDHRIFGRWSTVLGRALDPLMAADRDEEVDREDVETRKAFYQYFRDLIARGGVPADRLLPRLVQAEEEGDRLTEAELLATLALLVMAGHETTANLISHTVLTLLRHPEQLELVRADPSLVAPAVDEILRYEPSVQMLHRMAGEPMRFDGFEVPAGMDLLLLNAAANRDPEVFEDPERFDITRPQAGRLSHLSFSAGPHFCLGSALGRLEAELAVEAFVTRVQDPALVEGSLRYRPHVILRGPEAMRVSFSGIR